MAEMNFSAMCSEYLHSEDFRSEIGEFSEEAAAAVKAELMRHVHTGELLGASTATPEEFAEGYGMLVKTLYRSFFVANRKGVRRKPPLVRGAFGSGDLMEVSAPSVFGTAVKVFEDHEVWSKGELWQ